MYYPCSENKDADQLRGYREADLRLCFRPCKLLVFSRTGSFNKERSLSLNYGKINLNMGKKAQFCAIFLYSVTLTLIFRRSLKIKCHIF